MPQPRATDASVFAGVTHFPGGAETKPPSGARAGVFRLREGDGGWEQMRRGLPETFQVFCLTADPNRPGTVYAGGREGLYRTEDGGDHWERLGVDAEVFSVTVHPTRPWTLFAGAAPVAVWRSDDDGASWRKMPRSHVADRLRCDAFPTRVMRIAVDPSRPDEIYAAMEVNGVSRSRDGGESWEDCGAGLVGFAERSPEHRNHILTQDDREGMLDAHAVAVSAARPGEVIVANRIGLFRSPDGGATWADLEMKRFSPITYARDIRVAPDDPATLYACLSIASRSNEGHLFRSRDGGRSWTRLDRGVEPRSTMMAVAPHPADPATLVACAREGQVFATHDGGESWSEHPLPDGCRAVMALACC